LLKGTDSPTPKTLAGAEITLEAKSKLFPKVDCSNSFASAILESNLSLSILFFILFIKVFFYSR